MISDQSQLLSRTHATLFSISFVVFSLISACGGKDTPNADVPVNQEPANETPAPDSRKAPEQNPAPDISAGDQITEKLLTVSWADVEPIFAQRCFGCHSSFAKPELKDEATIKANIVALENVLERRTMPPGENSNWFEGEGRTLLLFAQNIQIQSPTETEPNSSARLNWLQVEEVFSSKCFTCHGSFASPRFSDESSVQSNKLKIINSLESKFMPPGESNDWFLGEGNTLLNYMRQ